MITQVQLPPGCCGDIRGDRKTIAVRPLTKVFHCYLRDVPLAHALFRSAECRALRAVTLTRPALDLGCGAGEFAHHALSERIDVGVDLARAQLAKARRAAAHRALIQADAVSLGAADESLASVLAVSVCEHFADPVGAFAEVYRVLKPGGRFVATIVLADLHDHLFYPRLLRRLKLEWLARRYVRMHDRVFVHRVLKPSRWWEERLEEAGFNLVVSRRIVAPRLAAWCDFWLATAWPYWLWRRFGTLRVRRPAWFKRWCWKMFQRLDADDKDGVVLLVVAEKPTLGDWQHADRNF